MSERDLDQQALVEATNLTTQQYQMFLQELDKIPTPKAPIDGKETVLCFEFMEDTGARVNETIHMQKKDIDYRTRLVTITHPKSSKRCKCSRWKYRDQTLEYAYLIMRIPNASCVMVKADTKHHKEPQSRPESYPNSKLTPTR